MQNAANHFTIVTMAFYGSTPKFHVILPILPGRPILIQFAADNGVKFRDPRLNRSRDNCRPEEAGDDYIRQGCRLDRFAYPCKMGRF